MEEARAGVEAVRLEREHHPLLEDEAPPASDDRLLLTPPGAHAVSDQDRRVAPAQLAEHVHGEVVDRAGRHAEATVVHDLHVGLAIARIVVAEHSARLAENRDAGLMPRIA